MRLRGMCMATSLNLTFSHHPLTVPIILLSLILMQRAFLGFIKAILMILLSLSFALSINVIPHLKLKLMASAFSALGKITMMGHELDVITLTTLMKGLCINGEVKKGEVKKAQVFHDKVRALGFQLDKVSYGTLVNAMCTIGEIRPALKLLQKLERTDSAYVVMNNTIIDGLYKVGLVNEAGNLFSKMISLGISPNVVPYTSLIHGFCCVGQLKEANHLLSDLARHNMTKTYIPTTY